jgi:hypothetical protein
LNGLRNMGCLDIIGVLQIGNGPGHLQDPRVGADTQAQFIYGHLDELAGIFIEQAMGFELPVGHPGVQQVF